ncbi:unnamed protein product, partial [Staurois parvus]
IPHFCQLGRFGCPRRVCLSRLLLLHSPQYRINTNAAGMAGTPHNGHSGCTDWELSTGMAGTPHNGHSGCTDPGTQHRDGNPS